MKQNKTKTVNFAVYILLFVGFLLFSFFSIVLLQLKAEKKSGSIKNVFLKADNEHQEPGLTAVFTLDSLLPNGWELKDNKIVTTNGCFTISVNGGSRITEMISSWNNDMYYYVDENYNQQNIKKNLHSFGVGTESVSIIDLDITRAPRYQSEVHVVFVKKDEKYFMITVQNSNFGEDNILSEEEKEECVESRAEISGVLKLIRLL